MSEVIHLGPVMLKTDVLAFLLSLACGFLMMKWRLKAAGFADARVLDVLLNSTVIVFLFWKFGLLLTSPMMIWERPLGILLYNGYTLELALGLGAALLYIGYQLWKKLIGFGLLCDIVAYGVLAHVFVFTVLTLDISSVNILLMILSAGCFVAFMSKKYAAGSGAIFTDFLVYYGTGLPLVSLFDLPGESIFYISYKQLGFILMIVGGMIHNKARKEWIPIDRNMENAKKSDSPAQKKQERENALHADQEETQDCGCDADKKTDGPNRPSI